MAEPTTADLLLDAFSRVRESVPAVLDGLTPEQAAHRPTPDANSIGWLVWHLTRIVDDHVVGGAAGRPEVLESGGFADRLRLDRDPADLGYGDSSEDVERTRFADAGALSALAEYHEAVQAAVADYLSTLHDGDDLGRVVDPDRDPPVTLAVRLVSVVDDSARHVGQAEYLRGLLSD